MNIETGTTGGEAAVGVGRDMTVTSIVKGIGIIVAGVGAVVQVLIGVKIVGEEEMTRREEHEVDQLIGLNLSLFIILYVFIIILFLIYLCICPSASPAPHGSSPRRSPSPRRSSPDERHDERNNHEQSPAHKDASPRDCPIDSRSPSHKSDADVRFIQS